jgi:hypothetical protein
MVGVSETEKEREVVCHRATQWGQGSSAVAGRNVPVDSPPSRVSRRRRRPLATKAGDRLRGAGPSSIDKTESEKKNHRLKALPSTMPGLSPEIRAPRLFEKTEAWSLPAWPSSAKLSILAVADPVRDRVPRRRRRKRRHIQPLLSKRTT